MRFRSVFVVAAFAVASVCSTACVPDVTFNVVIDGDTTVEGGGILGDVLDAFPDFGGFNSFDISTSDAFENNNAQKENVKAARLTSFTLEATAPDDATLDFLDSIAFLVSAPDLDEVQIASADIEDGDTLVELDLDDVDLAPYVRADSMTFTTEISGRQPSEDTTVSAVADVEVTAGLSP